jgi:hypothetical protein
VGNPITVFRNQRCPREHTCFCVSTCSAITQASWFFCVLWAKMKIMFGTYPQNVKMHYVERCILLVTSALYEWSIRYGLDPQFMYLEFDPCCTKSHAGRSPCTLMLDLRMNWSRALLASTQSCRGHSRLGLVFAIVRIVITWGWCRYCDHLYNSSNGLPFLESS